MHLPEPPKWTAPAPPPHGSAKLAVSGDHKLLKALGLMGIWPKQVELNASFQIIAELPDGSIQPLLWLQPYKPAYGHPFWLRDRLALPAGTVIRGVPPAAVVELLPTR